MIGPGGCGVLRGGRKRAFWPVLRRRLALIRCLLRGPASREALCEAGQKALGDEAWGDLPSQRSDMISPLSNGILDVLFASATTLATRLMILANSRSLISPMISCKQLNALLVHHVAKPPYQPIHSPLAIPRCWWAVFVNRNGALPHLP